MIVYQNITRRFGHASTDRQSAYLTKEEIAQNAEQDVLLGIIMYMCRMWLVDIL